MTSATVVTSFSSAGFTDYGKRMLESAVKYLPPSISLWVYYNKERPAFNSDRITFVDSYAISDGVADFVQKYNKRGKNCGYNPIFNGGQYNFRWDAIKFCHKVFAITDCAKTCQSNMLFWLDADSVIFDHIPEDWLDTLLPYPHYLSYLARPAYTHTDCSFMGFRLRHPSSQEFMDRYLGIYKSGRFEGEKESHDSYLFDVVRKEMEKERKITSFNLSKEDKGHVFVSSELGRFMDSLKGKRKLTGTSWREDLNIQRDEPYWQNLTSRKDLK